MPRSPLAVLGALPLAACASVLGVDDVSYATIPDASGPGDGGGTTDAVASDAPGSDARPAVDAGPITFLPPLMPGVVGPGPIDVQRTIGAGNLLVAAVYWTGPFSPGKIAVTDSLKNTWTDATGTVANDSNNGPSGVSCKAYADIQYALNTNAGADVVHLVLDNTQQGALVGVFLFEYTGIATTKAIDGISFSPTPTAAANLLQLPKITTTGTNDVVVALFVDTNGSGQMTAGAGFDTPPGGVDTRVYAMVEETSVIGPVGPGPITPTANLPVGVADLCWVGVAAAFRAP